MKYDAFINGKTGRSKCDPQDWREGRDKTVSRKSWICDWRKCGSDIGNKREPNLNVKQSRVAIGKDMANKIMVEMR